MIRDLLDFQGNIIGTIELPDHMSEEQMQEKIDLYAQAPKIKTLEDIVSDRLLNNRKLAPQVLVDIMTANVLAGITAAQSDKVFDDYADVILRIREGAFPTALYRLNQKAPQGFVSQELLDSWKRLLQAYL